MAPLAPNARTLPRVAGSVLVVALLLSLAPTRLAAGETGGIAYSNATESFVFAAAGDFGGPGSVETAAMAKRINATGASFLLALGDLGYTPDERSWCEALKANFRDVVVIAGNHDTTESGPSNISEVVAFCAFTLGGSVTGGPGTPGDGYGFEYYYDYPSANPLARFILIAAGVQGALNYDYRPGSAHYNWVVDSVNDARSDGIPWVIVGMHKQCITVGAKGGCDMGQAIFDKLVDLRVDLILQGHDHVYERSKPLALNGNCPTIPSAGSFDPDCIAADGSSGTYAKGVGSVVVVQGTGGANLYPVRIEGADAELAYFVGVMGGNANTQGRSHGYGSVRYAVSRDRIAAETDFCPAGSTGVDGRCPTSVGSTFVDSFVIQTFAPGAEPPYPWIAIVLLAGVAVAAVSFLVTRRRRKGLPPGNEKEIGR